MFSRQSAGKPTPAAPSRDGSHLEAARSSPTKRRAGSPSPQTGIYGRIRLSGEEFFRIAPSPEFRAKSVLLDITHDDPHTRLHLPRGSANNDGPAVVATSTEGANTTLDRDKCPSTSSAVSLVSLTPLRLPRNSTSKQNDDGITGYTKQPPGFSGCWGKGYVRSANRSDATRVQHADTRTAACVF